MPECAYMPCKIVFEIKPGTKGQPKKYCCRKCYLESRLKPKITRKCLLCGASFTTGRSSKLYCGSQCQQASRREARASSQTLEQTALKQRRNDAKIKARQEASLNCECHRACLRAEKLPCLNCKNKIWKEDAWKSELEYTIYNHNSGGENRMNLPARGTV